MFKFVLTVEKFNEKKKKLICQQVVNKGDGKIILFFSFNLF